jgi:hypothetical protein
MQPNRKIVKAPLLSAFCVCPILFLGVTGHPCFAQPTGTFTVTGSMTTPRTGHTATLLFNGKVLIAGGFPSGWPDFSEGPELASAELYDPSTGTFTATGNMTTGRAQHSATLLPDGRVLIAGGTAEIYDPSTGTFTATGAMVTRPYLARDTALLHDGRVFLAGTPTAQIYDTATGTFSATAPYAALPPAFMAGLAPLADGRVLLTTADNGCGHPRCAFPGTPWAETYDPVTNTFNIAGEMTKASSDLYTATLLTSGKVLFLGNDVNVTVPFGSQILPPAGVQIFDPTDGTFSAIGSATASHFLGATTLLPDGTVLITGGELPVGIDQALAEVYMPANAAFSVAGSMITARAEHTATLLRDGTVLIAGGSIPGNETSSAELYHPTVLVPVPLLFSLSGDGSGPGAIWHGTTGQVVSTAAPAVAGEILSMYTTGLIQGGVIAPRVFIGGRLAEIRYFGDAPGFLGFNQVNFRVPGGVAPGSAVPVRLTYLGRPSNAVTIAVQ